jgi:hypothetical protein
VCALCFVRWPPKNPPRTTSSGPSTVFGVCLVFGVFCWCKRQQRSPFSDLRTSNGCTSFAVRACFVSVARCCPHVACTAPLLLCQRPAASMYFPRTFVARGEPTGIFSCLRAGPNAEPSSARSRRGHLGVSGCRSVWKYGLPLVFIQHSPLGCLMFVLASHTPCISYHAGAGWEARRPCRAPHSLPPSLPPALLATELYAPYRPERDLFSGRGRRELLLDTLAPL